MLPSQNDDSSSIRRACSLSDLSMGKGKKNKKPKHILHIYKLFAIFQFDRFQFNF